MDICDELVAKASTVHGGAYSAMMRGAREIKKLRDWIKEEGLRTNACTYNVLREVCGNCQCKRATHPKD